ncbi:MAG: HAD-IIIC family phosphatase [Lachnospiraceae bacterium]|nr:HAD-IIIC family phosphatase [Lachnospiraceae bacterium]
MALDPSAIKLIIWDLDNTLWQGVLSEEMVIPVTRCNELVRLAADRGIVNAICSKNDAEATYRELASERFANLWELFVFPSIDWTPKGPRIRQMLQDMALRAENALFLDDEPSNRAEAEQICPGIMTAGPEILEELYCEIEALPVSDPKHTRLARYRILEKKTEEKKEAGSNEAFLRASDIRIRIDSDCTSEAARIHELLNRTNQLNFTKVRLTIEDVEALLCDDRYQCGLIRAKDRYGDYGEVGFYAMEHEVPHTLLHFAFSCRVLGMGIEQYLWNKLGHPPYTAVGETAVALQTDAVVDWICEETAETAQTSERPANDRQALSEPANVSADGTLPVKILLKGPCDIDSMLPYFPNPGELELEASFVDERGIVVGSNNSLHLYETWHFPVTEIRKTIERTSFLSEADFMTYMFTDPYRAVVFSTLSDVHSGVYRDRENGLRICFSSRNFNLTDPADWDGFISGEYANHNVPFNVEMLKSFAERFVFEGGLEPDTIVRDLKWMRDKLPPQTKLILLLGSEIEAEDNTSEFADHAPLYRALNDKLRETFDGRSAVDLVNVTDCITGQDCFAGCTNHFSRVVYRRLAEIIRGRVSDWI